MKNLENAWLELETTNYRLNVLEQEQNSWVDLIFEFFDIVKMLFYINIGLLIGYLL